ncbi:Serpentine receptor class r-10 [Caenorhabditis elegans]|uniref:Serpentine receptor class r-10 n=1 Tax=Caenorhabditis elegans TaxID=6239 RepID=Q9XV82_CAEEL|nr:Seven TM Receptor [Caenorhabditis elegans]CAB04143.1 Seven TM Receptor [Caenorhabditis elegans]|eukprot:NP_507418.1 Seven TM Receptor [Caenorhabditis elegans]
MFQQACAIISLFTNSLLVFLILKNSPPQLGTYKWLMLYTGLFELIYASLNIFVEPTIGTFQSVCYLFQDLRKSIFGHDITLIFILGYSSCFGFSLSIFASHFIYRYGVVNADFKQKYLSGWKQTLLYIVPVCCGVIWGMICGIALSESSLKSAFLRMYFQEAFNLKIEECVYVASYFWPLDDHGVSYPDTISFVGIGIMSLILSSSFSNVIYFGIKCYNYISQQLGELSTQSQAIKSLQAQLFYSLIFQFAIPCLLMYLPAGTIFMITMFDLGFDMEFPLLSFTVAIYPAIDPLPTIFIIKSYRRGLIGMLTCRKKNQLTTTS